MFGGKLLRFKILLQSFPALLDDPGVPDDLLSFGLSGVTEYVFFLEHFPEVCPVSYAVAYVLTNLVFFGVTVAAQELIEERLVLLGHFVSPSFLFPTLFITMHVGCLNGMLCLSRPLRPPWGLLERMASSPLAPQTG